VKKIHLKFLGVSRRKNDRKREENAKKKNAHEGIPQAPLCPVHAPLCLEAGKNRFFLVFQAGSVDTA